jgi:hypothetical protein
VKYWPRNSPTKYTTTDLVKNTINSIDVKVVPKITYQFQAVAREDKGPIGGIDWNKSPIVEFVTSSVNREVPKIPVDSTGNGDEVPADGYVDNPEYVEEGADREIKVAGMSIEILVVVVIVGLLCLLISIGVIYKLACGKKKVYDEDDEDDDNDDLEKGDEDDEEEEDGEEEDEEDEDESNSLKKKKKDSSV